MKNKQNLIPVILLALLILFTLGACGGSGGDKGGSSSSQASVSAGWDNDISEESGEVPEAGEAGEAFRPQDRKLITTVNLTAETQDHDEFLSWLNPQIVQAGGYVESSDTYGNHNSDLVLRIPADQLNAFLQAVDGSCNIVQRSIREEDVTLDYVDSESYRDALLVEQERLLQLLEKAESLDDIMTIEDRLTNVRYQLQNYESTLRVYDNQINYSTVYLSVSEVSELTEPDPDTWGSQAMRGMRDNARAIGHFFQALGLYLVTNLPTILLLGAILLIILLLTSKRRKEARQRRKQQKELIRSMAQKKEQEEQQPPQS